MSMTVNPSSVPDIFFVLGATGSSRCFEERTHIILVVHGINVHREVTLARSCQYPCHSPLSLRQRFHHHHRNMLYTFLATCAFVASYVVPALAHNIQMGAHSRECFHEQLHKDDKMTVTFQVGDREFGGSGNLDIDFWVWTYPCLIDCHRRSLLTI